MKEMERWLRIHIYARNANTFTGMCGSKVITTAQTAVQRWMVMGMDNTMYFVQCKECENCSMIAMGYFCDKHIHCIDNPDVDGCTCGERKTYDL